MRDHAGAHGATKVIKWGFVVSFTFMNDSARSRGSRQSRRHRGHAISVIAVKLAGSSQSGQAAFGLHSAKAAFGQPARAEDFGTKWPDTRTNRECRGGLTSRGESPWRGTTGNGAEGSLMSS
jgi:hypothetical protein